ncbi:DNA-binding protein snt1 [Microbotryomycetes sp. JL201]|nr:DNA-binding protein snt1 [Microbotryomycetes sp. JL201]
MSRDRPAPRYGRDARDSPPGRYASSGGPWPRERYRSPPPALPGSQSHSSAGPSSLSRDRWVRGLWDRPNDHASGSRWEGRSYAPVRDDYRPTRREDDRDRDWERDRKLPTGPSRPFVPDNARSRGSSSSGTFQIPYRNRVTPYRRGRGDASDDEDGYPPRRPISRPGSKASDKYPEHRTDDRRSEDRPQQAIDPPKTVPAPAGSDNLRRRHRSMSPGELSEGQIPTSTRSPTRSRSRTPQLPPHEMTPTSHLEVEERSRQSDVRDLATTREECTVTIAPAQPSDTIPLVSDKTAPINSTEQGTTSDSEAVAPKGNRLGSPADREPKTPSASPTTEASAIRVEPTAAAETRVTMTLAEPLQPVVTASADTRADVEAQATRPEPEVTSFVLERLLSPPHRPLTEAEPYSSRHVPGPLAHDERAGALGMQLVSPSSPLTSLPPTSPAILRQQPFSPTSIGPTLNGALLPPIDLYDRPGIAEEPKEEQAVAMDLDEQGTTTAASVQERDEDDSTEGTRRGPSPQEMQSPPQPESPPNHFKAVLLDVIAANPADDGVANAVIVDNRARTKEERAKADVRPRKPTEFLLSDNDEALHAKMLPLLLRKFEAREQRRGVKMVDLRNQYKQFNEDWSAHCKRLDQIKARIQKRNQPSTVPQTPAIDGAGLPFYPEPTTPGPSIATGRANRRSAVAGGNFGYGDAVRSEAEFLEILASLETADMRDPTVRATRTAAVVPDMIIDDTERREFIGLDVDCRRRVDNPVEFYGIRAPLDLWTEDEVQVFCKRFSAYPKQFGKIAAALPDKSTAQCVLFYYRMKNTIDFRSLSDRRGPNGKRRKPKRKLLTMDGDKRGSSLLSNLQRMQADDREEDDGGDSPPPSPQATRRLLPSENAQVFRPPDFSIRDDFNDSLNGAYEDDDSYFARPIKPGKGQKTPRGREAALDVGYDGISGGFAGGDDVDDGPFVTPGVAEDKVRKRKQSRAEMGVSDGEDYTPRGATGQSGAPSLGSKRKSGTSSYWSVAERTEILRLLGVHGKDWTKIAEHMGNKTAIQCRNWYQNNVKKLKLEAVVRGAGQGDSESGGSPMPTPNEEYTAPPGTRSADGQAIATGPRAGFFLPDQKAGDSVVRAGMQIRNLLNDDGAPDEKANPSGEDWFGGNEDGGSATTEEEIEQRDAAARDPLARPHSMPHPYGHDRMAVDSADATHRSYYAPNPTLARLGAVAPHSQSLPSPLASWHSSPAGSPSPAYSPYGTVPSRPPPFEGFRPYDRLARDGQRPASAGAAPQSTVTDDYFASRPQFAAPFAHTSALLVSGGALAATSGSSSSSKVAHDVTTITSAPPTPTSTGLAARQATPSPLTAYSYAYNDLPYQINPYPYLRGPQSGYNICNSTTEGPDSQCQTAIMNDINDFCLWGAPGLSPNETIGDIEAAVVAYCTKAGHGTRVLPPNAITGLQMMRTPGYVQWVGRIDQTALGLQASDPGGELDPHGADQLGNPLGGAVFSPLIVNDSTNGTSINGTDTSTLMQVVQWNNFIGSDVFCFKLCTSSGYEFCENRYDLLGCSYNAPAAYQDGVFLECLGDNQDVVGTYTGSDGQTSTWSQPSSLDPSTTLPWTPRVPASSSCTTYASSDLFPASNLGYQASLVSGTSGASATASGASATGASGSASASAGSGSGMGSAQPSATASSAGSRSQPTSAGASLKTGAVAISAIVAMSLALVLA